MDEETCPICFDSLNTSENNDPKKNKMGHEFNEAKKTIVTLDCRHKFHYECIVDWFKQRSLKNPYSYSGKSIRVCPYCRTKTGHIELPNNVFPVKHIHKEFKQIETCLKVDDFDQIIKVCKPYFNPKYCFCVLKTGKSKGQQCRKYKSKDSDFCHLHKKKYESIKNI